MCPWTPQLGAIHDGEVDAVTHDAFAAHLPACDACPAELERLSAVSSLFAASRPAGLSPIGMHRLHRAVEATIEQGLLRTARAWAAVAACILISGSLWLWTAKDKAESAPPWVGTSSVAEAESPARATPAAEWYLADASLVRTDNGDARVVDASWVDDSP